MGKSRRLSSFFFAALPLCSAASSSSSGDDDEEGGSSAAVSLGRNCLGSAGTEACGDGLECIDFDAIGGFVCIFDGNDGHVCARVCQADAECAVPGSVGLRCVQGELSTRKICAS